MTSQLKLDFYNNLKHNKRTGKKPPKQILKNEKSLKKFNNLNFKLNEYEVEDTQMTLEADKANPSPKAAYQEYLNTKESGKEETHINTNNSTADNSQEDSLLSLKSETCEFASVNKYFMALRPLHPLTPASKTNAEYPNLICFNSNLNKGAAGAQEIGALTANALANCNCNFENVNAMAYNYTGSNWQFGNLATNNNNNPNFLCICKENSNSNNFNTNLPFPTKALNNKAINLNTNPNSNSNSNLNLNTYSSSNNPSLKSLKSSNPKQLLSNFPNKLFKKTVIPLDIFQDLFDSLILEERSSTPCFGYMQSQTDINEKMRAVLIDWLSEVHLKFKLFPETIFLTVNIIDRYLSQKPILKNHLQLCGVAALLIACKFEEIYCPDLSDLVYITDKAYSKEEIVFMEKEILKTLNYEITVPTPIKFYELLAVNFALDETEFFLGRYFLEIFLMDYRINKYQSSLVACAVVYLVLKISKYEDYRVINSYSLSAEKDLKNCAKEICFLVENIDSTNLLSIKTKYSAKEFHEVSKINFNCAGCGYLNV